MYRGILSDLENFFGKSLGKLNSVHRIVCPAKPKKGPRGRG
jgi:hypothetical protein